MITIHEVSELTGVTVRALRYYDRLGLLKPAAYTEAGYRLYDERSLSRLREILLFRELKFELKEIRAILDSPTFSREKALEQQIELLSLQKEHLEDLISLARRIQKGEAEPMDFTAFDTAKLDSYAAEARKKWGHTEAYREYEEKAGSRSETQQQDAAAGLMAIFEDFGRLRELPPESPAVQEKVQALQAYITTHYYRCTDEILAGLGSMYAAGGDFTANIDKGGGKGTASFVNRAIRHHCAAGKG